MFISELFEAVEKQVVAIYPGRFQPPHRGHAQVFNHLCQTYGTENCFICTSDKVEPPKSPFNFREKQIMWAATGVDPKKVVQSTQPYRALEIVEHYDTKTTILLFAISEKDMAEDPRFQFKPKKDGSPSYFQSFINLESCKTLDQHAYMITVPTFNFKVLGKPANSATQIRAQFAESDEDTQMKIVTDLFGKFNPKVFKIMQEKLGSAESVAESIKTNKFFKKDIVNESQLIENVRQLRGYMHESGLIEFTSHNNYRKMASRLLSPKVYVINESIDLQGARKKIVDKINELDQIDQINIKVGTPISIIEYQLLGNYLEIWGFTTPKKITKVYYAEDNKIEKVEFNNDPNDCYPRVDLATYQGQEIQHSAFFKDKKSAEQALMILTLGISPEIEVKNFIKESQ